MSLTAYGTTTSRTPSVFSVARRCEADMDIRKLDSCCRVKALRLRHKPARLLELQCLQASWSVPSLSHRSIPQTCHPRPLSLWATCSLHWAPFRKETILLPWKQHHMLWLNRRVSGTCRGGTTTKESVPQEQEAKQLGGVPWVLPLFSEISSSKGPTENPRVSLEASSLSGFRQPVKSILDGHRTCCHPVWTEPGPPGNPQGRCPTSLC